MEIEMEWLLAAALIMGATGIALMAIVSGLVTALRPGNEGGRVLAGTLAKVTVAIPQGGVGAIAHGAAARRSAWPARHVGGAALDAGTPVVVVDVVRGVVEVRALPPDLMEVFR